MEDAAKNDADRVSFLGTPAPKGCQTRTVLLQPGDALTYRVADWSGTLVVVEKGELEVECGGGARARFGEGAVLALDVKGLAVRRLHSVGPGLLILSGLSRDPE